MNILFLGHSLIEFFDWQARFPEHNVANLGVAGESVGGLLLRLESAIRKYPFADLIFIMTGINDIALDDYDFFNEYREIIKRLRTAYPETRIYVNSLLPVLVDFISNDSIRNVNNSLKKLAIDAGVEYLDIYRIFVDKDGSPVKDYLLDDGVHLSNKGYAVWSGEIERIIKSQVVLRGPL